MARMRRSAAWRRLSYLAAAIGALTAGPSFATDWSISGQFSQRVVGDTNLGFDPDSGDGPALASTTDVGLRIAATTKTTSWVFAPGVRGALATDESFDVDSVRPRFTGSVGHERPGYTLTGQASFIPEFATFRDLDDDDETDDAFVEESRGLRYTARASGALSLTVDSLTSLNLSAFGRLRDDISGSGPGQTLSYGASAGLSRRLDALTSAQFSVSATQFDRETGEGSRSYSTTFGLSREMTPRLSLSGSLGPSYTDGGDGGSFSMIGGGNAAYRLGDANYSLGLSQNVAQSTDGDLSNRLSLNAGMSYNINASSRFSVTARLSRDNPVFGGGDGGDRESLVIAPRYGFDIDRDWRMNVGYTFRAQRDTEDETFSNAVFVSVSRGFDVLR